MCACARRVPQVPSALARRVHAFFNYESTKLIREQEEALLQVCLHSVPVQLLQLACHVQPSGTPMLPLVAAAPCPLPPCAQDLPFKLRSRFLQHAYADTLARFPPFSRLRPDLLIDVISQIKVSPLALALTLRLAAP